MEYSLQARRPLSEYITQLCNNQAAKYLYVPNPLPPVLVSPTALVLKLYRYCASPVRILFRLTAYITSQLAGRYNRSRSPTSTSSCDTHSFGCSRCSLSRYSPISFNPKREKPRSVFWKRERRSKLQQEMKGIAIQRIPTRISRYVWTALIDKSYSVSISTSVPSSGTDSIAICRASSQLVRSA